jgi:uncharacterized membrane protein YhaH (DUF805 family)
MSFTQSISSVFRQYFGFSGRACRSEYWWFFLFQFIVGIVLAFSISGLYFLFFLYVLGTIIPGIAVLVRRLHDTGNFGWLALVALIPLIGGLIILIIAVTKGQQGENKYGPDPLMRANNRGFEGISATSNSGGDAGYCTNCGSVLESGANFCRSCGATI